jgi:hypothetical protein
MGAWRVLLVGLLLVAACSSADQGGTNVDECVTEADCGGAPCVNGRCKQVDDDTVPLFDAWDKDSAGSDTPSPDAHVDDAPDDSHSPDLAPSDVPTPDTPDDLVQPADVDPAKAPSIFVDPNTSYTFTYIEDNPEIQGREVTITNAGQGTLIVDVIDWKAGSHPAFSLHQVPPLPLKLEAYAQATFTVGFVQKPAPGPAWLRVHSNDPQQPWVEVKFDSYAKITGPDPVPCIQVLPATLNYGTVVRGQSKALDFTVRNCDTAVPLVVKDIARGAGFFGGSLSAEFQLTPQPAYPLTVPPGGTFVVTSTYSPGLAGPDSGKWIVKSTDPDNAEVNVNVTGTGVPPPLEDIGLHINVEWDADDCDVDTHLLFPGGSLFTCPDDCFYGNSSPDWGTTGDYVDDAFLDYDDIDGYGPENINVQEPKPGKYRVVMHYFRDNYESSSGTSTNVTVQIYLKGVLAGTYGPQKLTNTNDLWQVVDVDMPAGTLTPLGNTVTSWSGSTSPCAFDFPF